MHRSSAGPLAFFARTLRVARRVKPALAAAALVCGFATAAEAQQTAGPVVQLPTFNFFTVNTTVSVPDRGGAFLGGIGRRSAGSNQFGGPFLPGNRSGGANTGASGMSVHVQIHDMSEYDAQILAEARRKYGAPSPAGSDAGVEIAGSTAERGAVAIADLDAVKTSAEDEARVAALDLIAKGRAAEAAGKAGAAKAYYRMAARKAPADLASEATAALRRLDSPRVAQSASE